MNKGKVIGSYRGRDIYDWIEFDPGVRHSYVGIVDFNSSDPVDVNPNDLLMELGILYRHFKGRRKALSIIPSGGSEKPLTRISGHKTLSLTMKDDVMKLPTPAIRLLKLLIPISIATASDILSKLLQNLFDF